MKFRPKFEDSRYLPDLTVDVDSTVTFEAEGDLAKSYLAQPDLYVRVDTPARQKAAKARRSPKAEPPPDLAAPVTDDTASKE